MKSFNDLRSNEEHYQNVIDHQKEKLNEVFGGKFSLLYHRN